jgi:hypothetical protein
VAAHGAGEWPRALDLYAQVLSAQPDHRHAHLRAGVCLQVGGSGQATCES